MWVVIGLGAVALMAVGLLLPWLSRRMQTAPPGRSSTGLGDALGNFIDVFDPGQARASRDLKRQFDAGPVSRIPDDEDDDPVRLIRGPDGSPRAVRIRRGPRSSRRS